MSKSISCVGLTFDLKKTYLKAGYSELEAAEFDREDTIDSLEDTLRSLGYQVDRIGNIKQLAERLVTGDRWDLVFNICEGMYGIGREAQVPGLLDAYNIPYVFSDTVVCAVTLHKGMTKDIVRAAGVATPDYFIVNEISDVDRISMEFPLFVKPVAEGTSKGITARSKIGDPSRLREVCQELLTEHRQPVLVERFLPGREFTVGMIGSGNRTTALATMEITLTEGVHSEAYSYHNKTNWQELVRYSLLPTGKLRNEVEDLAIRAWRALGCRDGGRIDVRLDESGQPSFIEVNPLAGMHPERSDLPMMATMAGIDFISLIGMIMSSAELRLEKRSAASSQAAA
ncbi:MAG: ATP-grasp domain-containing protein [Gammaproteobacteria bacterium]|nr:ATP-grasp domain-containing protein [Gammaproteobacteria bacterium]